MPSFTAALRPRWAVAAVAALVLLAVLVVWLVTRSDGSAKSASTGIVASGSTLVSTPPSSHVPSPSLGTSFTPGSRGTVPDQPARTQKPVPLKTGTAHFGGGLDLRVIAISAIQGKASEPGEISGPALRFVLQMNNSSRRGISLDNTVVSVYYGKARIPAGELTKGEQPFRGSVRAGGSARAVYVYGIPLSQRSEVRLEVSYTGAAPTVAFGGPA